MGLNTPLLHLIQNQNKATQAETCGTGITLFSFHAEVALIRRYGSDIIFYKNGEIFTIN